MKTSPIQVVESFIEKFHVEINADFEESGNLQDVIKLDSFQQCRPAADFWKTNAPVFEGVESRTFTVRLGVRTTGADAAQKEPYQFEMICSAVVVCIPVMVSELTPEIAARQYGLTLLFGVMREQLLTVTGRMPYGQRLLPVVSFMEAGKRAEPALDEPKGDVQRLGP